MNRNQECLITILKEHGNQLSTSRILELTKFYPELCKGCSSGSQVISAGMALIDQGTITRIIAKGGFLWSLKQANQ